MNSLINELKEQRPFPNWNSGEHELFASNDGEDDWCIDYFGSKYKGKIIDIGSADLCTGSNSFRLMYECGWKGFCVEALPHFWDYSEKVITKLNLDCTLIKGAVLPVYNDDVENTIFYYDEEWVGFSRLSERKNCKKILVPALNIQTLLNKTGYNIDVLSIDVEGMDEQILKIMLKHYFQSNVIITEKKCDFLSDYGYRFNCKTKHNFIYSNDWLK